MYISDARHQRGFCGDTRISVGLVSQGALAAPGWLTILTILNTVDSGHLTLDTPTSGDSETWAWCHLPWGGMLEPPPSVCARSFGHKLIHQVDCFPQLSSQLDSVGFAGVWVPKPSSPCLKFKVGTSSRTIAAQLLHPITGCFFHFYPP